MTVPVLPTPASGGGVSPILQNTQAFLDLIQGNSKTTSDSGGTKTTQTDVSAEGIAEMMRQMMEGTGGLADLAMGAHTAGVYGDTTKMLLAQNLMTKIAGQAAALSAKSTTTTSPSSSTTKTPAALNASSAGKSLLLAGITSIGGKYAKKSGLLDAIGLGDDAAVAAPAQAIHSIQDISDMSPAALATDTASDIGTMGGSIADNAINSGAFDALDGVTGGASVATESVDPSNFISGADADEFFGGGGSDVLSGALDGGGDVASTIGDSIADSTDFWSSFIDPYKRGGRIPGKNESHTGMKGYAEGGLVNLDRGTPPPVMGAQPINDPIVQAIKPATSPAQTQISGSKKSTTAESEPGGGSNPSENTLQTAEGKGLTVSQAGQIALAGLGFVSNPVLGLANVVSLMSTDKSLSSNALDVGKSFYDSLFGVGAVFGPANPVGTKDDDLADAGTLGLAPVSTTSTPTSSTATSTDSTSSTGESSPASGGPNDPSNTPDAIESMISNAVDSYDLDTGELVSSTLGTPDVVGSTETGPSEAGPGPGEVGFGEGGYEAGAPGFSEGGKIVAPGDGEEDTRIIKGAKNEFVLNANAAKAIGIDKLVWLNTVLGGPQ